MAAKNFMDGNRYFDDHTIPIIVLKYLHDTDVDVHSHDFYEFVYIDQGFSSHYYNQITTILTPGDVFGIRPGDVHGYTRPKQTILYNCLFRPEAFTHEMDEVMKLPGIGRIFRKDDPSVWQRVHLDPIGRKEVVSCLEKMKEERQNQAVGWEIKIKSLLMEFLVIVSRNFEQQHHVEPKGEYKYTQYIYQALNFMEKNLNRPVQVEEIAETIGLSADYFSRLFKQFTGLSPMEYMKNVRLAKATELLKDPFISVSKVAMEVGIDDPSYFTRQFKQALGVSPSQYQQNFR